MCVRIAANTYTVSANSGLNVRESATSTSAVIGKLSHQEKVDVSSIEGEWAKISWKGQEAYVNVNYLTKAAVQNKGTKGWHLWDWLFNSDGDSDLFKIFKWVLAFVILLALICIGYVCLAYLITIISGGLSVGGMVFLLCLFLKWLGLMSWDTLWVVTKWGFYLGCGVGLIMAIFNPRIVFSIMESNNTSKPSRTGLSTQVNRFEGVRTRKCCGSCAYCTGNYECNNTSCDLYLHRVNIDNDGQYCYWYSCRY